MTAETSPRRRAGRWLVRTLAVIGGFVVFMGFVTLIALLVAARGERVPGRTILELDLEEALVEHVPDEPVAGLLARRRTSVRDVVEALHRAADDDRVLGLVARAGGQPLGMGQAEEIRDAVLAFRRSGKPAVLFSETFGEFAPGRSTYYLATAFDSIFLQPSGDLGLTGIVAEAPFFRGTLDRVGVEPRIDQRREYKTAANHFTEQSLTEAHREELSGVLESLFENLVAAIAEARGLTVERVRERIAAGPLFGEEAVRAGLVDRLAYRDEVYDSLRARLHERAEFLYVPRYLRRAGRPHQRGETIALIYGVGAIQRGESRFDPLVGGTALGAETVTQAFRQAIADSRVRAIVFRIDSPGGSYVASDAIWREVVRARAAGKPVIASMGNTAGSGGYYVAMAADRIVAQPSTLTGSIGVYAGKVVTRELWEHAGVSWDTVQIGGNATMWSMIHDYSPEEWNRLQSGLDRIYADFTAKAAQGRNLSREQIERVARGRVWTGAHARQLGLVDELGGFTTALRLAREAIGIAPTADVRLVVYPERRPVLLQLLDRGEDSSYPAAELLAGLVERTLPFFHWAQRSGLLAPPGALWMPEVWEVR